MIPAVRFVAHCDGEKIVAVACSPVLNRGHSSPAGLQSLGFGVEKVPKARSRLVAVLQLEW
jgi:hypothetical protein